MKILTVKKCLYTICPRSSDPFYIVPYYIKEVTTSWTKSNCVIHLFLYERSCVCVLCVGKCIIIVHISLIDRVKRNIFFPFSIWLSLFLSLFLSLSLSISNSVCLSVCLSMCVSVFLPVCFSVCLSAVSFSILIFLSLSLSLPPSMNWLYCVS